LQITVTFRQQIVTFSLLLTSQHNSVVKNVTEKSKISQNNESISIYKRKLKFLTKLQHSGNTVCRLFGKKHYYWRIGYCARTFV